MSTTLLNAATSRIHAAAGRTAALLASAALLCALTVPGMAFADEMVNVDATASSSIAQAFAAAESGAATQVASGTQDEISPVKTVLDTAYGLQGTPYRAGGATPQTGFDCSGFTMYCFAQAGVSLTHNAAAQYGQGTKVAGDDLQPGDLVFFGGRSISHVGIYVGDGRYIHSKQTGDDVCVETLADRDNYVGAVRVL